MKRTRIIVVAAILVPLLWCFGSALFRAQSFAFRDSAHYYYPLFEWTAQEWGEGRIPLWNPHENAGVPAVADSTSSVFYPGKLIFALPISFAWRFKLYIVGHILLAAWGAYLVARCWKASPMAAGVCALSYAFGGNVLFQYCNVVFLVGAAWLPLAVLAADRMLVQRRIGGALAFAVVLALMVLGGDPQAAYHAGLLAALYALILWRADRKSRKADDQADAAADSEDRTTRLQRFASHRLTLLSVAALASALLAAIQIIPSMQWSRQSTRAAFERPRSVYEIPQHVQRAEGNPEATWSEAGKGIFGEPVADTHHGDLYQFSVGPWHAAEFVWPNFSGRLFPEHRRWIQAIPAEDRAWTPSMYMGLLPLLLALGSWKLRGGDARQRWLSWTVVFGLLGSLGFYGLGWVVHEVRHAFGADANDVVMGQPVGGLYWLLVTLLPGYAYFRFPAKLMVFAALGLSLLAARGWDQAFEKKTKRLPRALLGLAGVSLVGVLLVRFGWWASWVHSVPPDSLYGPFRKWEASEDLVRGLFHTWLLCLFFATLLHYRGKAPSVVLSSIALLITAADLAIANGWMVVTAPSEFWERESLAATRIEADADEDKSSYRVLRGPVDHWTPSHWHHDSSEDRVTEGLAWDRDTLFPRYQLMSGLSFVESPGAITSFDHSQAIRVAYGFGPQGPDGFQEPHPMFLNAMSTKYLLLPERLDYDDKPWTSLSPVAVREVRVWKNPHHFPRAWIVHSAEKLPPLRSRDPTAIAARTQEVFFPEFAVRDLSKTAVIETNDKRDGESFLELPETPEQESCRIVVDEPQRVEIEVELNSDGLLVLNDFYQPDWTAELISDDDEESRPVTVYRTNRIMRGVVLPAGEHRVVFRYRPRGFWVGAVMSAAVWLLLIAVVAYCCAQRRRRASA